MTGSTWPWSRVFTLFIDSPTFGQRTRHYQTLDDATAARDKYRAAQVDVTLVGPDGNSIP